MKPKVFIGCSREGLDFARKVESNLASVAEVTVWPQGSFELGKSVFDSLISFLNKYDFGIFIFWLDDTLRIRDKEYLSVRDNVVLEFGLFTGGFGKERTFFMYPSDQEKFHRPSDLDGIIGAAFESSRIDETLEQACSKIKKSIQEKGICERRLEINNPKILCASSAQYAQLGFDQDVKVVQDAFPDQVTVAKDLNFKRLRELLKKNRFDIVHMMVRVDLWSGELVLSEIDLATLKPISSQPDSFNSEAFSSLIEASKTQLVVLATWNTLSLAAKLARVTNVISLHDEKHDEKDVTAYVKWEKCFYEMLSERKPLSVAFEDANKNAAASMYLMMKKDVVFVK